MSMKTMIKTVLSSGMWATLLVVSAQASAEEIEYPAQQPLSLIEGISPNILLTIDDSGSMAWAFTPDAIYSNSNTKRSRSSFFNAQYYNPDVVYQVPKKITLVGGEVRVEDYPVPSFTNAPTDGFSGTDRVDLSRNYVAQWYYDGYSDGWLGCIENCQSGSVKRGGRNYKRSRAYYYEYTCPNSNSKNTESCYTHRFVQGNQQERNFAIWYSFYRNRLLATKSAASLAFYRLPESMRLTWGGINACNIGANSSSCQNNKFDLYKGQHKVNFYTWLDRLDWTGSTPSHRAMIRAGELLKKKSSYTLDPQGNPYSCQASYHVFMTDGMWNQRPTNGLPGNADNTAISRADLSYSPSADYARPYADSNNNTLADLAFHYWANDLLPGTANNIKPRIMASNPDATQQFWDPRNNPATWQHMVNYMVGLGLSNSLTNSSAPTWDSSQASPTFANLDELKNLRNNGKSWPSVGNDNNNNVYDLWHAAINSRGEFFSADTPDALVAAFEKIILTIGNESTSASSPAINSGVGDDGTGYAFQATYSVDENWAGDLKATEISLGADGSVTRTEIWSAAKELQDRRDGRTILMAGSTSSGLKNFDWNNLSADQKVLLNRNPDLGDNIDSLGSQRLDFLRGERSLEGSTFRTRTSILGDIVNSKPVTVRGARYLTGHANRIEGTSSDYDYGQFLLDQQSRTPMVYVGANDGMLHAFNADTGREEFAFVPSAVIKNLHKLTGTGYGESNHQFFVDGSPVVADVFINNQWRTVLVGTLGAGGKGIFALDVTDVGKVGGGPKLLWEFGEEQLQDKGDQLQDNKSVKMGYSFPQPTIARLHNGKWAVVTGNGYSAEGSTNGKAALLIIDVATGNLTTSLEVSGENGIANGLSTPKLADINGDGIADYAYAGDLQGNVWRFDMAPNNGDADNPFMRKGEPRVSETVQFQVSFGANPLFTAKTADNKRQPVMAAPSIVRHPTGLGYLIVFGTGKYFAEGDKNGNPDIANTLYGVWDPTTKIARSANKSGFPYAGNYSRSNLQQQTMQSQLHSVTNGGEARLLSNHAVEWAEKRADGSWRTSKPGNSSLKAGWYFDLAIDREMIVADMLQFGRTLYLQSLVPNTDPCSSGVDNWSYAIDPVTGGRTLHHAWTDFRSTSVNTQVITAVKMDGEGGLSLGQKPDSGYEVCTGGTCNDVTPDPASIGRQSWRIVEGL